MISVLAAAAIAWIAAGCSRTASRSDDTASPTAPAADSVAATPDSLTFAFVGDIMMGTSFPETPKGAYLPADSGRHLFDEYRELLTQADVAAGNFEGVMIEKGTPKHCNNPALCFTFRMPPYLAPRLTEAGFDFMNVANNHAEDFLAEGVDSTFRYLQEAGLAVAGNRRVGPTAIIERKGLKIGFTGFSTGASTLSALDLEECKRVVTELAQKADIVVVALHAGGEGTNFRHVPRKEEFFHSWPRGDVWKFAHTAIDCGADIVWGHGPHLPRGAELYRDRLIMYSLGNFCTPVRMGIVGLTGLAPLVRATIAPDGRFLGGQIHSFVQRKHAGPTADPRHGAAREIKSLSEEDLPESPLKISEEGRLSR